MNCREARRAIVERSLEPLMPERDAALRRHLGRCACCAAAERFERRLKNELATLRGECPQTVNIRQRVMRELSGMGSVERDLVTPKQIGWAAAAAIACSIGLLGSLPWLWPQLTPLLAELKAMAATFGRIGADLTAPFLTLISLPFKLAVAMLKSLSGFSSLLSKVEPAAIGTIAICFMAMAATITLVVGRDLRKARPARPDREE